MEDKNLLAKRLSDAIYNAREKYMTCTFGFFDQAEQCWLLDILKSHNYQDYMFWGGYDDAERKCLGIFSGTPQRHNFPISFIKITADKFSSFTHRDCMGAILACGLKREIIGDISLINSQLAYVAVYNRDELAEYICSQVKRIGRATVKCQVMQEGFIPDIKREFEIINFTVASPRLDSIVAGVANTSRSVASKLIKEGSVTLNHQIETRVDLTLKFNDVFSIRKIGKFVVLQDGGLNKKAKLKVNIKKFL